MLVIRDHHYKNLKNNTKTWPDSLLSSGKNISRVMDPEKKAYLVRNKKSVCNMDFEWPKFLQMFPWRVLGGSTAVSSDQKTWKRLAQLYYLPNPVVGTICSHSGYRDSILQSDIYWRKVRPLSYSTTLSRCGLKNSLFEHPNYSNPKLSFSMTMSWYHVLPPNHLESNCHVIRGQWSSFYSS